MAQPILVPKPGKLIGPVHVKRSDAKPTTQWSDALSTTLATFGKAAREAVDEAARLGDADTADVFTEIGRETDKQLWLVDAHQMYSQSSRPDRSRRVA